MFRLSLYARVSKTLSRLFFYKCAPMREMRRQPRPDDRDASCPELLSRNSPQIPNPGRFRPCYARSPIDRPIFPHFWAAAMF
jgi:hypothetical protein